MTSEDSHMKRGALRTPMLVFAAVFAIGILFRLTEAGNLEPAANPTPPGTMNALASISDSLTGSWYDSSSAAPDRNGNVLEVTKCIIAKMTGGICPGSAPSVSLVPSLSANLMFNGGASDCDGDGDLDDACVAVGCSDFLFSIGGTYTSVTLTYGGESSSGMSCAFAPTAWGTCGEIGTLPVTVSVCNGSLCASDASTLQITDFGALCP